jgi:formate hydrogenlyase subunit 4
MKAALLNLILALALAPLLPGIINRAKAWFAGRKGPPVRQLYYDLYKLCRKGAVYSRSTSWIFRFSPVLGLAVMGLALLLVPMAGGAGVLRFPGDLILFVYLLGLARFFMVLAALDTASSFEGMGGSREMQFAVLTEVAFLVSLGALAAQTREINFTGIFGALSAGAWLSAGPALALVAVSLAIIFLVENCRIPFDDPNTHLELTMIHEVMVLDYGGPDFAFIQYASSLKMWILGSLITGLVLPVHSPSIIINAAVSVAGLAGLAVSVGVVESVMARLRLLRVPQLLLGAIALALVAVALSLR